MSISSAVRSLVTSTQHQASRQAVHWSACMIVDQLASVWVSGPLPHAHGIGLPGELFIDLHEVRGSMGMSFSSAASSCITCTQRKGSRQAVHQSACRVTGLCALLSSAVSTLVTCTRHQASRQAVCPSACRVASSCACSSCQVLCPMQASLSSSFSISLRTIDS